MNPFVPRPALLVFDLDGTLLDSLPEITSSLNELRRQFERSELPAETVRRAIGDGALILLERTCPDILDAHADLTPALLFERFRQIYVDHSLQDPRYYPGAREFLELARAHCRLAVLTNKPEAVTGPLLARLEIEAWFVRVLCPENARARKPSPEGLRGLLEELGLSPSQAVFIGDSSKDFEAGRGAGVHTVGMRGGYGKPGGPEPDFWADDFATLLRLFAG